MKQTPQLELILQFDKFIKASGSGRRLTPSNKKITKGTIIVYLNVLRLLSKFEAMTGNKLRIQLLHRASMRTLQREKNYWSRFYTHFSSFLYKENHFSDSHVYGIFKVIKTFFNYLQNEKGLIVGTYHKSFRVPVQQAAPVVLTPGQLNFLITNKEFEQQLNPHLKRVKDIFIFGCTVGLRYSDLMALKKSNVICEEDQDKLVLFTQKTVTEVKIPLPPYLITVLAKYRNKAGKYLLPRLSSSNLNVQIKKLVKKAGWDHYLPKIRSVKGKMIELKTLEGDSWPFYQHITPHTMRRTAITTLLILGVPENVVRKISGHAPGSKEFYRYVAVAQEYLNREVKNAYQKLIEMPPTLSFKKSGLIPG